MVNAYLTFNGNCREAMVFYKKCLGGALFLQTVGESPAAKKLPVKMKKCILHAELNTGKMVLMGTDIVGDNGLLKGNNVSLVLSCKTEKQLFTCYKLLSEGGKQTHPLADTYWNALFGGLTDKFGNHWLLKYNKVSMSQQGEAATAMVEVFKTNISNKANGRRILSILSATYPLVKFNIDLADCDKILRAEGVTINVEAIIAVVRRNGFDCATL
jgi:PhnB protein